MGFDSQELVQLFDIIHVPFTSGENSRTHRFLSQVNKWFAYVMRLSTSLDHYILLRSQ